MHFLSKFERKEIFPQDFENFPLTESPTFYVITAELPKCESSY
jgi:hypothetical protein